MTRARRLQGAVATFVCLAVAPPACADWTIGGFLGGAHTHTTSLRLIQPLEATDISLSPVSYRSKSLTPPLYYAYRFGFFPRSRWFGIEGELIHLKVHADTTRTTQISGVLRGQPSQGSVPMSSVIEDFSISHGVNLVLINAVARRGVGVDQSGEPRWTLTGRFGAGTSRPHPESTIGGRRFEGYEWGSPSVQIAAGVEMRVIGTVIGPVSLVGEYKLTRTVQEVTILDGTARTPLTTHHFVGGAALRLGSPRRAP